MTRAQILTLVKTLVAEGGTNFFTDAAYVRFIDDAYFDIHLRCSWDNKTSTTAGVVDQQQYVFTGFSQINRVDFDDRPMEPVTAEWLRQQDTLFATASGRPQFVFIGNNAEWGYDATDTEQQTIALYPTPDNTDTIRVMGVAAPAALPLTSTVPNLPHWVHRAIAYEAAAMVLEAQGEQRADALSQAYRILASWWVDNGVAVLSNRHASQKVHSIGGSPDVPRRLMRDRHINGTGLTGL